jgi:hypothetical protein
MRSAKTVFMTRLIKVIGGNRFRLVLQLIVLCIRTGRYQVQRMIPMKYFDERYAALVIVILMSVWALMVG